MGREIWIFVNDIYLNEYLTISSVSLHDANELKYLKETIGVKIYKKKNMKEWKTTKIFCFMYNREEYVIYCQICKIKCKYNGPNIMIGQHFCSLFVYKAWNRICNYIEIRALAMTQSPTSSHAVVWWRLLCPSGPRYARSSAHCALVRILLAAWIFPCSFTLYSINTEAFDWSSLHTRGYTVSMSGIRNPLR
jgi:hypothetical protein